MHIKKYFDAIPADPGRLRQFGIGLGAALGVIGLVSAWRGHAGWISPFTCFSPVLLILGLAAPRLLKPVYKGWMGLLIAAGRLATVVLLAVVYYSLMFPLGFAMRKSGKDLLNRKFPDTAGSFWIRRLPKEKSGYENQY